MNSRSLRPAGPLGKGRARLSTCGFQSMAWTRRAGALCPWTTDLLGAWEFLFLWVSLRKSLCCDWAAQSSLDGQTWASLPSFLCLRLLC